MTKVLIVDDMDDIRYAVKGGLEALGKEYEVIEAKNGDEALQMLPETKPDIVLMDVMMPGTDGLDTTIKIKNDPSMKDTLVIILTAKTDSLTKGIGEVAADAFLEKPFDIETLDQLIEAVKAQKDVVDA